MAVGDSTVAAGWPLVVEEDLPPIDVNSSAYIRWAAREINITRDLLAAHVRTLLKPLGVDVIWSLAKGGTGATTKDGARVNLGITSGPTEPAVPAGEGHLHFKVA